MTANEASVLAGLRTIVVANTDYNNNSSSHSYADSLAELSDDAGSLVGVLTSDPVVIAGYRIVYTLLSPTKYKVDATPIRHNETGVRSFALDQSGIVLDCDNEGKPCESDVLREDEPPQEGD